MKGHPLLRFTLAVILLGGVFWPVYRITSRSVETRKPVSAARATPPIGKPSPGNSFRVTLLLHAAPDVQQCSILQGGRTLLSQDNSVGRGDYEVETTLIPGEDLLIGGEWGNDDPHALRVRIIPQGSHAPLEKTYWAEKSLKDTLIVPETFMP